MVEGVLVSRCVYALQAVGEFYVVMGEEMIALTGQRERVEAITAHIQAVTRTIENVDFDPFHVDNARLWAAVMVTFWQEVHCLHWTSSCLQISTGAVVSPTKRYQSFVYFGILCYQ